MTCLSAHIFPLFASVPFPVLETRKLKHSGNWNQFLQHIAKLGTIEDRYMRDQIDNEIELSFNEFVVDKRRMKLKQIRD